MEMGQPTPWITMKTTSNTVAAMRMSSKKLKHIPAICIARQISTKIAYGRNECRPERGQQQHL
jgi:hypothetical protein